MASTESLARLRKSVLDRVARGGVTVAKATADAGYINSIMTGDLSSTDFDDLRFAMAPAVGYLGQVFTATTSRSSSEIASDVSCCILETQAGDRLQALILQVMSEGSFSLAEAPAKVFLLVLHAFATGAKIGQVLAEVASGKVQGGSSYGFTVIADGVKALRPSPSPSPTPTATPSPTPMPTARSLPSAPTAASITLPPFTCGPRGYDMCPGAVARVTWSYDGRGEDGFRIYYGNLGIVYFEPPFPPPGTPNPCLNLQLVATAGSTARSQTFALQSSQVHMGACWVVKAFNSIGESPAVNARWPFGDSPRGCGRPVPPER